MRLPCSVRILGLDLGIVSAHRGVVVDGEGRVRARRSAVPTAESLTALEAAALRGAEPGARLMVVIEPTGPAWLPVAVFFGRRGHLVVRVSSAKAADLRRFLSRHAKTNGIDAETLARLPLVGPESVEPVELSGAARASLDRRVRAVGRLTAEIGERKTRIRALAAALMPTVDHALGKPVTRADLAVLARWGDPRALRAVSLRRLTAVVAKASGTAGRGRRGPSTPPPSRRWRCGPATAWSRWPTWPPSWAPRSGCCTPPRSSGPSTRRCATPRWPRWTPTAWPPPCPAWARSVPACSPRRWADPAGSPTPRRSSSTPGWPRAPTRPATPTARASR